MAELNSWALADFSDGTRTFPTYRKGTGPGVVVVHEIPGLTPAVAAFGDEVVGAGFTVVMPSLFGAPGAAVSVIGGASTFAGICVRSEFARTDRADRRLSGARPEVRGGQGGRDPVRHLAQGTGRQVHRGGVSRQQAFDPDRAPAAGGGRPGTRLPTPPAIRAWYRAARARMSPPNAPERACARQPGQSAWRSLEGPGRVAAAKSRAGR